MAHAGSPGRYAAPPHANSMPYYSEAPQTYGSAFGPQVDPQAKFGQTPFRGAKRRTNLLSVFLALLVPCAIFAIAFTLLSFDLHYSQPQMAYSGLGALFVLVLLFAFWSIDALKKRDQGRDPTWYIFIFATSLLAWTTGAVLGNANYFRNMQPFYDILNLNVYNHVDPTVTRGQQLMDAGRIFFTPGTALDLRYSMTFKNLDTYCVAPLTGVNANGTARVPESYDYWAVGLNCCNEWKGFRCGEFNNPKARSGLRLMRDDLRPFFRLAVQQAEAAYNVKAVHPLFLYWMQDPAAEVHAYEDTGYRYFSLGLTSFCGFQLFAVIFACISFAKSG